MSDAERKQFQDWLFESRFALASPQTQSCMFAAWQANAEELTRLQSEVERLRGRCEELEADQQYAKGTLLCPNWAKSQVLIKQAEAVEQSLLTCDFAPKVPKEWDGDSFVAGYIAAHDRIKESSEYYAQRLRQQAAESAE